MTVKHIEDVAKELDLATSTIRKWEKDFLLSFKRNSKNNRVFTEPDVLVLQSIKALKDEGSGTTTIIKKLNLHKGNIEVDSFETITNKGSFYSDTNNQQTSNIDMDKTDISLALNELSDKMNGVIELSEKYSRACYEVGSLRAELKSEADKTLLISDSLNKDVKALSNQLEKLNMELEQLRQENNLLKDSNQKLTLELSQKNKPFWKRFK